MNNDIAQSCQNVDCVVAYSGGLDSTVLMCEARRQGLSLIAVNFLYGSRHNESERKAASQICEKLEIPYITMNVNFIAEHFVSALLKDGPDLPRGRYDKETMAKTVVPGRNGIFLSILAGYAESVGAAKIGIANHAGDHFLYPDCRPEWISAMAHAISLGSDSKVNLWAPFTQKSKADICNLGMELNAPLEATWSCYAGGSMHCGSCGTCLERKKAFCEANISDPTNYLS